MQVSLDADRAAGRHSQLHPMQRWWLCGMGPSRSRVTSCSCPIGDAFPVVDPLEQLVQGGRDSLHLRAAAFASEAPSDPPSPQGHDCRFVRDLLQRSRQPSGYTPQKQQRHGQRPCAPRKKEHTVPQTRRVDRGNRQSDEQRAAHTLQTPVPPQPPHLRDLAKGARHLLPSGLSLRACHDRTYHAILPCPEQPQATAVPHGIKRRQPPPDHRDHCGPPPLNAARHPNERLVRRSRHYRHRDLRLCLGGTGVDFTDRGDLFVDHGGKPRVAPTHPPE